MNAKKELKLVKMLITEAVLLKDQAEKMMDHADKLLKCTEVILSKMNDKYHFDDLEF